MKTKDKKLNNSSRLLRLRELLQFSQRQMADEFGVVHGAIGLWETGKRKIPGPVLKLIKLYEEELGIQVLEEDKGLKELQQNWLGRTLKLSGMSVALTQHISGQMQKMFVDDAEAKNRIQQATQLAVANQVVDLLGTLKGIPHKFGQFVSYMDLQATDEVQALYAHLQADSPALHPARIAEVIVEDFGRTPRQLFQDWSNEAFAAASIGQVHRATTQQGEAVAVKVQYPGIRNILAADLKNVKLMDQLGSFLMRQHTPGELASELAEHLMNECDYRQEAKAQIEMRELHQADSRILIPRVHSELSSEHVLTSDYVAAKNFREFCATGSQAEKDFAGEVIWDHAFRSAISFGIFNADPHPGNYLFLPKQVVFLDYGCVKRIPADFLVLWKKFLRAVMEDKRNVVDEVIVQMGVVVQPEKFDFVGFYHLMREWYLPCYSKESFRFSKSFVVGQWEKMWKQFAPPTNMRFPKELLYINQLQWGLYAVLAHLEAGSNWSERFLPLLEAG